MSMWNELHDLKDVLSSEEYIKEKKKRAIGFFLGPIIFILLLFIAPPSGLSLPAWRCLALTLWAIVWWVCEPFAVPTTSVLVFFLLPVLGILPPEKVYSNLGHTVIFMIMGAFIIVEVLKSSGLGKRIALWAATRSWVNSTWRLAIAVSLVSMLLSSIMPNIPVAILMIGIVSSMLENLEAPFRGKITTLFYFSVAFSATIGGIMTPIGATGPNFALIGIVNTVLGVSIPFSNWVVVCTPVALLMLLAMIVIFTIFYKENDKEADINKVRASIIEEYESLGRMKRREWYAFLGIVLAVVLWVLPGISIALFGSQHPTTLLLNQYLSMEKVALFVAMLLLTVPLNWKERKFALSWKEASQSVDFGLLLFIALAFALPAAFTETGLLGYITGILEGLLGGLPTIIVVFILVTVAGILSQFGLQMPVIAISVPVTASLINIIGGNPVAASLAVAMVAVGGTYFMPIASPTNMIPFATGRVSMADYLKGGGIFMIITILLLSFVMYPLGTFFLSF
ncbi:MAG: SLC13 family permease [Eubacteriales bacterium]